jgi:ATP-binding cassette subfamily F protein 3
VSAHEWLRFSGLERFYGAREIFSEVAGVLRDDAKVGLVGPNGAGKSSLVRILAGLEPPDAGDVVRARDARLGYLSQTASGDPKATLRAQLEGAFTRIHRDEARVRELEHELQAASESGDEARQDKALRDYGDARETFDRHGGEGLERRMHAMLETFGFDSADLDKPAAEFSGGQRTRASLARMLLEEPDYLILDEPTNHLDLDTVRWLENFLADDPRAALVVSHDRYFLDRVASEIWELDGGSLERYDVPRGRAYSAYVEEKALRAELAERAYENFLTEEKRRKAVVAELKTHGSHNYTQVRSREKQLAKLAKVEAPRTSQRAISVKLESARRATGGLALEAVNLSKSYEKPLFADLSFELVRGERLAIVGPNGSGKSTLLGILAERFKPDSGRVKLAAGMRCAYFDQDSSEALPAGATAVEAVMEGATVVPEEARALLGRLGLGGDAGDKPVEAFSGGERRRIVLARLMAQAADLLFLDEPTNDLDIPSREALEAVLAAYGGALVVVSHDRYLLQRLAERVLWLRDGTWTMLEGGYEAFERLQRPGAATPPAAKPKPAVKTPVSAALERDAKQERERRAREVSACEREVAKLDATRAEIQLEFADPGLYDDRAHVEDLERRLAETDAALASAYERWERLLEADAAESTSV